MRNLQGRGKPQRYALICRTIYAPLPAGIGKATNQFRARVGYKGLLFYVYDAPGRNLVGG
jgi:hypothetical protein